MLRLGSSAGEVRTQLPEGRQAVRPYYSFPPLGQGWGGSATHFQRDSLVLLPGPHPVFPGAGKEEHRAADEPLRRPGARRDSAQRTNLDISLHTLFEHVMPNRLQPANQTGSDWF